MNNRRLLLNLNDEDMKKIPMVINAYENKIYCDDADDFINASKLEGLSTVSSGQPDTMNTMNQLAVNAYNLLEKYDITMPSWASNTPYVLTLYKIIGIYAGKYRRSNVLYNRIAVQYCSGDSVVSIAIWPTGRPSDISSGMASPTIVPFTGSKYDL